MPHLHYLVKPHGDSPATRIVSDILRDVTDRRGWAQEWDLFDDATKEEIVATWLRVVQKYLAK